MLGKQKQQIHLPSQRYEAIMQILIKPAAFCGCNFLLPNYRPNFLTYTSISLGFLFLGLTSYTIKDALKEGDFIVPLQSLCYSGLAFQGLTKLLCSLSNVKLFLILHEELKNTYITYERISEKYCNYLIEGISNSKKIVLCLMMTYALTTFLMLFAPIGIGLYYGEAITVMQFNIPGLEKSTQFGYISLTIVHATCIVFGMFGNFASDAFLFLMVSQIPMLKNLLKCKFDDMNDSLSRARRDTAKISLQLKNIIKWHLKYMDIKERVNRIYFWVIFVEIASSFISIICTIVCMFLNAFPTGPSYLLYALIILYSYCALGNLVEISNDDVTTMIYDCNWYELPTSEQKIVLTMLRQSEMAVGLSIGGVRDLTLNSALQITKTIYSITMLLSNSFQ